jgi:hypothetical protein
MVVYSIYSVCLSVALIKYEKIFPNKDVENIFTINLSVILLGLALYLNSRTFKDRAQQFKNGYISLQNIESRLKWIPLMTSQSDMISAFDGQFDRYSKLLSDVENHTEFDDLYGRYRARNSLTSRKITKYEYVKINILRILKMITLVLFYILPILAICLINAYPWKN